MFYAWCFNINEESNTYLSCDSHIFLKFHIKMNLIRNKRCSYSDVAQIIVLFVALWRLITSLGLAIKAKESSTVYSLRDYMFVCLKFRLITQQWEQHLQLYFRWSTFKLSVACNIKQMNLINEADNPIQSHFRSHLDAISSLWNVTVWQTMLRMSAVKGVITWINIFSFSLSRIIPLQLF